MPVIGQALQMRQPRAIHYVKEPRTASTMSSRFTFQQVGSIVKNYLHKLLHFQPPKKRDWRASSPALFSGSSNLLAAD
jgi:hypothetical protein